MRYSYKSSPKHYWKRNGIVLSWHCIQTNVCQTNAHLVISSTFISWYFFLLCFFFPIFFFFFVLHSFVGANFDTELMLLVVVADVRYHFQSGTERQINIDLAFLVFFLFIIIRSGSSNGNDNIKNKENFCYDEMLWPKSFFWKLI